MMKYNYIKEIETGLPNYTQHQSNAHTQKTVL